MAWDGMAPCAGDVVELPDGDLVVVEAVAAGPGVGQWRLTVGPVRVIRWATVNGPGDAIHNVPGPART